MLIIRYLPPHIRGPPPNQVVLLNLLIAVMSETWSNIKEHEEVEWKLLSVSSIDEFFQLHHVPPPFNCVQLLRHLHRHFADGSDLPHHATSSPPLLSREDIKKRAKTAQLKVLNKQRQEDEQLPQHMLEQLGRQQREMADRLEKLAGAADRTSSELRQLTVERRAEQNQYATAGSTRDLDVVQDMGAQARLLGRYPAPPGLLLHASRFPPLAPRSTERVALPRTQIDFKLAPQSDEGGDSKSSTTIEGGDSKSPGTTRGRRLQVQHRHPAPPFMN